VLWQLEPATTVPSLVLGSGRPKVDQLRITHGLMTTVVATTTASSDCHRRSRAYQDAGSASERATGLGSGQPGEADRGAERTAPQGRRAWRTAATPPQRRTALQRSLIEVSRRRSTTTTG
jgi:hypothetical protein